MTVLGVLIVAWCSDAGGDAAKMRRDLVELCPWIIVLDCWAHQVSTIALYDPCIIIYARHQINLIVGDYFKLKLPEIEYIDMATELIKWFNNHSYAHGLLRAQQLASNTTALVLFLPVLTRWTSHYLAIRRLLLLKRYLQACVTLHYEALMEAAGKGKPAKARAKRILAYVHNEEFWKALEG